MAKADSIRVDAKVIDALPNAMFRVELENGLRASGRLLVDEPRTGMELVAGVGLVREKIGKDVYGFMFTKPE